MKNILIKLFCISIILNVLSFWALPHSIITSLKNIVGGYLIITSLHRIQTHTHTHTHIRVETYVHTHTHSYTYTYTHVYTRAVTNPLKVRNLWMFTNLQRVLYSKKLWRSKSLAKRATARHWRKKLWRKSMCHSVRAIYLLDKYQNASQMKWISGIVLEISIDAVIACCLWWDGYTVSQGC